MDIFTSKTLKTANIIIAIRQEVRYLPCHRMKQVTLKNLQIDNKFVKLRCYVEPQRFEISFGGHIAKWRSSQLPFCLFFNKLIICFLLLLNSSLNFPDLKIFAVPQAGSQTNVDLYRILLKNHSMIFSKFLHRLNFWNVFNAMLNFISHDVFFGLMIGSRNQNLHR